MLSRQFETAWKNAPLVTIIVPVYNVERYLKSSILSAVRQSWVNTEIIIVDDGSTDGSLEIANSFQGESVKVFSQKNKGACAARNYGLSLARGEFIQFLDGDDILPVDKIQKQVEILKDNPDCLIGCNWVRFNSWIDKTIGGIGPHGSIRKNLSAKDWLVQRHMMCVHSWLTPRNLIERAGAWNENLLTNQDGEFFTRVIACAKSVLFRSDVTVFYRTEPNHNGVSARNSISKYDSLYESALSYKRVLVSLDLDIVKRNIAIGNYFKELEYLFYPLRMDLVNKCKMQPEVKYATLKFGDNLRLQMMERFLGWKFTKKLQLALLHIRSLVSRVMP